MEKQTHTPTPYKIDEAEDLPLAIIQDTPDGLGVLEINESKDNPDALKQERIDLAFIVKACNAYDGLVKTLKLWEKGYDPKNEADWHDQWNEAVKATERVLANIEA